MTDHIRACLNLMLEYGLLPAVILNAGVGACNQLELNA